MIAIAIKLLIIVAIAAIKVVVTFFLLFGLIELLDRRSTKRLLADRKFMEAERKRK
jgi:hypothetical protein